MKATIISEDSKGLPYLPQNLQYLVQLDGREFEDDSAMAVGLLFLLCRVQCNLMTISSTEHED